MKTIRVLLALAIAVCALGAAGLGIAERGAPSKSAAELWRIRSIQRADGGALSDGFEIHRIEQVDLIAREVARIVAFVQDEGMPVASYFDPEVRRQIAKLLPEDRDIDQLICYENVAIMASNYRPDLGDVTIRMSFATPYPTDAEVLALAGTPALEPADDAERSALRWTVLSAHAEPDGLDVTFHPDVFEGMGADGALLVVLSDPLDARK